MTSSNDSLWNFRQSSSGNSITSALSQFAHAVRGLLLLLLLGWRNSLVGGCRWWFLGKVSIVCSVESSGFSCFIKAVLRSALTGVPDMLSKSSSEAMDSGRRSGPGWRSYWEISSWATSSSQESSSTRVSGAWLCCLLKNEHKTKNKAILAVHCCTLFFVNNVMCW